MTTPHPLRKDLDELLNALQAPQGRAVRAAIVGAVHHLFDAATATPEPQNPPSDTNGSDPEQVEAQLGLIPPSSIGRAESSYGFDPPGRAT